MCDLLKHIKSYYISSILDPKSSILLIIVFNACLRLSVCANFDAVSVNSHIGYRIKGLHRS